MQNFNQFHFKGQKDGEEILMVVHRHWFDILSQFLIILAMLLLLFGSLVFASPLLSAFNGNISTSLFLFGENIFFIFIWLFFFIIWIDYYFDVWIVTNERIVNIEQNGLFSRDVSELELERVQDITVEVLGIIPTFLNYGDLYVQTAGETERFIFKHVPNPYGIKDLIMNLQKTYEKKEADNLGAVIRKEIHEELT
ncbi:MAG: PH domain-containing protein [Candidatus Moranbacteria bacterium]|nr:PH domain-containing protein [Candidatus Moranbacteria bacterium]